MGQRLTANVFNIQRFSVHDGDGIRTTVFFSGCPLSCLWCHNPEGISPKPSLLFHAEKCVGCGKCVDLCNANTFAEADDGGIVKISVDRTRCSVCGRCVGICTADARAVSGVARTVEEIVRVCVSDRIFYEESGGGVTLSGGEVMSLDQDFLLSLLRSLRREDISVNIDTCGLAPYEKFEAAAPFVDTFLYDIKSADSEKHKFCTGVGNELILENLRRLSNSGARIAIRVPVIAPGASPGPFTGANYTDDDVAGLIRVLDGIKYVRLHLLPYHDTGSYKRASLGFGADETRRFAVPTQSRLEKIKHTLENAGISPVVIG